jgi:ABC-type dipeptide transport system, periplasmic component
MDFAYSQLHTGPWSQDYMGYSNPEIDRLFELGRFSLDQAERVAAYSDIISIYRKEIPSISMRHQTQFYVIRSTLDGLENHPQNLPHFYLVHSK